jgi:hypothetical protein
MAGFLDARGRGERQHATVGANHDERCVARHLRGWSP